MWNDLLTTALVGTERRTLDLDNLPEAFKDLGTQLEGQDAERHDAQHHDAERTLLALAGAMTLYRRVGQTVPLNDAPPLDPCDLDDLPPCSPRAGLILQQILALSQHRLHLEEWITAAVRAGQRISEEYLPTYLTRLNRSVLPEDFYEVLGKRGRWLAQQNEGWTYALLPQNDTEWESASFPARLEYVRRLRLSDPAHGLALIEAVWKQGKSLNRIQMRNLLEIGLNLGDEPFLEAMLGDYSSGTHYLAEDYLAKLPGSAFSQRMSARAEKYVHIGWRKKKLVIDVTLPEVWDESMGHDGIEQEPTETVPFDLHTYWLYCIVQKLSSAYWLGGDWSADDLVQAASQLTDWRKMIVGALAKTIEREKNDLLANALLQVNLDAQDQTLALSGALPATRNAFVLQALEQDAKTGTFEAFSIIRRNHEFGQMWSSQVTRALISTIARLLPKMTVPDLADLSGNLPLLAMRLSPDCADEFQTLANVENKSKPLWSRTVKLAVATLEYRRSIYKEFAR